MITIETKSDYITISRLLRKSRALCIRIRINGSEYLWAKNEFTKVKGRSIHDMHMDAFSYINNCAIIARRRPSVKNEQLHDARNFVESTRILVNIMKGRY